jgi:hypothetical protein
MGDVMTLSNRRPVTIRRIVLTAACCALLAPSGWAQQASGIAGVVRDTSGAVLPGVTVEASSPALIEKVRGGVTDAEGRYNIVDLRPGTYVVTFTLTGFSTFKREGIELEAGFTATVNADMRVGTLEETITVTGATPLVDTSTVRRHTVVSNELLDALPSGSRGLVNLVTLTPGVTANSDVGGSLGVYGANWLAPAKVRGKTGVKMQVDGMRINNMRRGSGQEEHPRGEQRRHGVEQHRSFQSPGALSGDLDLTGHEQTAVRSGGGVHDFSLAQGSHPGSDAHRCHHPRAIE